MVRSDLVIAGSNFIFSHIKENYSMYLNYKKKFLVIFRGINVDYFDSSTTLENDEKKLLKIKIMIFFVILTRIEK